MLLPPFFHIWEVNPVSTIYYKNGSSFTQLTANDIGAAAASHNHNEKLDKVTTKTTKNQVYMKLPDGSQAMRDIAGVEGIQLESSDLITVDGLNDYFDSLWKEMYPIGAIYVSYESTTPATLFGGTWVAITGRFPYFNAGTGTGGSAMHYHWQTVGKYQGEGPYITDGASGIWGVSSDANPEASQARSRVISGFGAGFNYNSTVFASMRDDTGSGMLLRQDSTYEGSSIPPYQALYAWRRTA